MTYSEYELEHDLKSLLEPIFKKILDRWKSGSQLVACGYIEDLCNQQEKFVFQKLPKSFSDIKQEYSSMRRHFLGLFSDLVADNNFEMFYEKKQTFYSDTILLILKYQQIHSISD